MCSCENDITTPGTNCPEEVIQDKELFEHGIYDHFAFDSVWIEGNCLKATIEYGGGCGDALFRLIWDGEIIETNPVSINLKLSFVDNDTCKALIHKELGFNIHSLQVGGYNLKVIINLEGWDKPLIYSY